ncbi:MAG TPA: hypothetical protein VK564_06045, partial [Thermodesulfobacteriota bacterium]|nr:hypothetical protein [Thermodesulfobacteriota bacterium]
LNSSVDISYGWTTKETFSGDSVSPFEIQNEISYFFTNSQATFLGPGTTKHENRLRRLQSLFSD